MLGGAIASIVALLTKRALGLEPFPNDTLAYWFGVALGGALFGLGVGWIVNRTRS